jgi:CHASE3 domain sensor protein
MSAFAVAHAVPLSLGLTSFLGYLVGVTYVLPFKLGSQMAVHTAAAFLIYAGGMLSYAWRHSPRNREGLPKWLPAVPAVMLPLLFVGISDAGNGGSMLAWLLPLFVGVMSDGLVALAAYRLTKTRIAYKGLTLISVPVIFVLAFVLLVNQVMRNNKKAEASYLQSKEVIAQTDVVLESLQDAESGIRGYVITSDPAFSEPFDRSSQRASEGIKRLQNLVQDNPTQAARATRLGAITGEKLAQLEKQLRMVRAGDSDGAIAQVRSKAGLLTMDEFRREMADFLTEEHKLDEARRVRGRIMAKVQLAPDCRRLH